MNESQTRPKPIDVLDSLFLEAASAIETGRRATVEMVSHDGDGGGSVVISGRSRG